MAGQLATAYIVAAVSRIHELIGLGYERIRTRDLQAESEEHITGLLVQSIRTILDSREAPEWSTQFSVHEEQPVTTASRSGRSRRRIDFVMELVTRRPRPRFPFEAKRLYRGDSVTEYVGAEGLGCFLTGAYPTPQRIAGIVAYVQEGAPEHWVSLVEQRLGQARGDFRVQGTTNPILAPIVLYAPMPNTYWSLHYSGGEDLHVYHTFLLFSTTPS